MIKMENTNKLDRIMDFVGMFNSFDEIKREWNLNSEEVEILKQMAEERYGKPVFKN